MTARTCALSMHKCDMVALFFCVRAISVSGCRITRPSAVSAHRAACSGAQMHEAGKRKRAQECQCWPGRRVPMSWIRCETADMLAVALAQTPPRAEPQVTSEPGTSKPKRAWFALVRGALSWGSYASVKPEIVFRPLSLYRYRCFERTRNKILCLFFFCGFGPHLPLQASEVLVRDREGTCRSARLAGTRADVAAVAAAARGRLPLRRPATTGSR